MRERCLPFDFSVRWSTVEELVEIGRRLEEWLGRRVPWDVAGEIAQEAVVAAWESASPDRFALAWVFAVARRRMIDRARRADTVDRHLDGYLRHAGLNESRVEPDRLEAAERRAIVHAAVVRLPAASRAVLLRRFEGGESVQDIAAALGLTRQAIEKRLRKARDQLRPALASIVDVA